MDRNHNLVKEVRAILRSPTFGRSPSLSSVLDYLLVRETSADGPATQYDIALEAMGKSADFNEITDSAVRVQMSRLRKALSDYYLVHAPLDGLYVHIRTGEYRLRAARLEAAYPDLAKAKSSSANGQSDGSKDQAAEVIQPATPKQPQIPNHTLSHDLSKIWLRIEQRLPRHWALRIALPIAFLIGIMSFMPGQMGAPVTATMPPTQGLQVPYVAADYDFADSIDLAGERMRDRLESDVRTQLQRSMISRLAPDSDERKPDYVLRLSVKRTDEGTFGAAIILSDRDNKVITERSIRPEFSASELLDHVHDEVTSIVSPAGQITRDMAAKIEGTPRNDFECFLFVETSRAGGSPARKLLDQCLDAHPAGEFAPYLRVRRAFFDAQATVMSGQQITPSSKVWREVADVLKKHPENPYANALAAKLLIGRGRCSDAASFAREGFSRGRTYPALELAVIVDAYGCEQVAGNRPYWSGRIARVADANTEPHPLLEAYILIGIVLSDQEQLLGQQRVAAFSDEASSPMGRMLVALRSAAHGEATRSDLGVIEDGLPGLIFSPETRAEFLIKIRGKHLSS